jgi:glycosyltransferase involved in cell wall biosynthesis
MNLLLIDYAGHIPQADLAKQLAWTGNKVRHLRCSDYVTGNADFRVPSELNSHLDFRAITVGTSYNRYNPFQRITHEIRLAKKFSQEIQAFGPDYVISSNVPLFCSYFLTKKFIKRNIPYIFWWQDVYSEVINAKLFEISIGLPVKFIQKRITALEKFIAANAHNVVAISENFLPLYKSWELNENKICVIPNWSPPDDFKQIHAKELLPYPYVLYAGTLGMKHNPQLLSYLATKLEKESVGVKVVVISQGLGRKYLESKSQNLSNLVLIDFLALSELKNYLSGAEVVLAILEPSASEYSVPSKIMTYLASGKATVAAMPKGNPAARYIAESNSGIVVDPTNPEAFASSVIRLLNEPVLRKKMELNARQFAKDNFNGEKVAKIFLKLMIKA